MIDDPPRFDSLIPPEVAEKAEGIGVKKARMVGIALFFLAVLAGAFIALGALFYTITITNSEPHIGYGLTRMLGGLAFCLGLVLVVVGGAELFTGNNLLIMARVGGKVTTGALLRNWTYVYVGNFVGALLTAWFIYLTDFHHGGAGAVGVTALKVADAKCDLSFLVAFMRGIYCNALVCLAVWLTYSCRSTGDKILAIILPIAAFIAAGFEHCVANMYLIPLGLMIRGGAEAQYWADMQVSPADFQSLTISRFLVDNLVPVTLGNIVGGAIFVGLVYWIAYRRATPLVDPFGDGFD